jgi:hypothetical protein
MVVIDLAQERIQRLKHREVLTEQVSWNQEQVQRQKCTLKGKWGHAAWPNSQVPQTPRSLTLLWIGFNDYSKGMYIIIAEISDKWEGISKSLPNKVSSEPRWQFERRCVHETACIMRCKWGPWLASSVGTVPARGLLVLTITPGQ